MTTKKRKIIAIVGPTASGKTSIGVKIAKEFNGEIVSADSRQVYRGLNLGTGKEGAPCHQIFNFQFSIFNQFLKPKFSNQEIEEKWETINTELRPYLRLIDGVPQWLIDIKEPGEQFNLFDYLPLARAAIEDIFSRGKTPIIVGGTGLYVQGLVEGFELKSHDTVIPAKAGIFKIPGQARDDKLKREHLEKLSKEKLGSILQEIDPKGFEKLIDKQNPHRLIRAIERAQEGVEMVKEKPDFEVLQIGITWPKEVLNERIDKRVDERFEQGMLSEVENLINAGINTNWLIGLGLEYRIIGLYLLIQKSKITPLRPKGYEGQENQNGNEKIKIEELIVNCKLKIENFKSFDDMSETLKLHIHQYAKRQMTWFKRFPEIEWLQDCEEIKKAVRGFLEEK